MLVGDDRLFPRTRAGQNVANPSGLLLGAVQMLVHIGQAVIGNGGTVDYLVDAVFNYPTLAESYKVAVLDAMHKMNALARATG